MKDLVFGYVIGCILVAGVICLAHAMFGFKIMVVVGLVIIATLLVGIRYQLERLIKK